MAWWLLVPMAREGVRIVPAGGAPRKVRDAAAEETRSVREVARKARVDAFDDR